MENQRRSIEKCIKIIDLNDDCFVEIFNNLINKDLIALCSAHDRFHNAINRIISCRQIRIADGTLLKYKRQKYNVLEKFFETCGGHIKNLKIDWLGPNNTKFIQDMIVKYCANGNVEMCVFEYFTWTKKFVNDNFKLFKSLKSLEVKDYDENTIFALTEFIPKMKNLKNLKIIDYSIIWCDILRLIQPLQIETLGLYYQNIKWNIDPKIIIKSVKNLRLGGPKYYKLKEMTDYCFPNLETLYLSPLPNGVVILELSSLSSNLKKLEINNLYGQLQNDKLPEILKDLNSLEALSITDEYFGAPLTTSLFKCIRGMTKLKELHLNGINWEFHSNSGKPIDFDRLQKISMRCEYFCADFMFCNYISLAQLQTRVCKKNNKEHVFSKNE